MNTLICMSFLLCVGLAIAYASAVPMEKNEAEVAPRAVEAGETLEGQEARWRGGGGGYYYPGGGRGGRGGGYNHDYHGYRGGGRDYHRRG